MFKYLIVFLLLFSIVNVSAEKKNKEIDFAWQSNNPVQPPDFKGYFPDDPEAGKRLDILIKNKYKGIKDTEEYLEIVRKGFRNIKNHRTLVLARIGRKYIWNIKKQNPMAIELMYHATNNPDRKNIRYYAIYFGLSVVKPKTPAILKALVAISMTTDNPNDTKRIVWGTKDQRKELIEQLKPYLASKQKKIQKYAQALKDLFSGKLSAKEYWSQNPPPKLPQTFRHDLIKLRRQLAKEKNKTSGFAWQSTDPIQAPDFKKYFPDDQESGKWLDLVIKNNYRKIKYPREILEIARRGLRNMKQRRTRLFSYIGWKYISHPKEHNPLAIELMYHASGSPDIHVRYDAIYYGLSKVKPKTPAILKALVDIAMGNDDPSTIKRIIWGAKDQQKKLIEYLKPYLKSKDDKLRKHAEALKKIFSGKLSAWEYRKQNLRAKAQPLFGYRMKEFREQLTNGDSAKRLEIINIIRQNNLRLITKDHDAWLDAYTAAAQDPDPKVRRWTAQLVGSIYIWNNKKIIPAAVNLLLKLANDDDSIVRQTVFPILKRLPKDYPAQAQVAKIQQANQERRFEEMRQALLKAVRDGKFGAVDKFLQQIKPNDRKTYPPGERGKVQALYSEISKKLSEALKSKNFQPLKK